MFYWTTEKDNQGNDGTLLWNEIDDSTLQSKIITPVVGTKGLREWGSLEFWDRVVLFFNVNLYRAILLEILRKTSKDDRESAQTTPYPEWKKLVEKLSEARFNVDTNKAFAALKVMRFQISVHIAALLMKDPVDSALRKKVYEMLREYIEVTNTILKLLNIKKLVLQLPPYEEKTPDLVVLEPEEKEEMPISSRFPKLDPIAAKSLDTSFRKVKQFLNPKNLLALFQKLPMDKKKMFVLLLLKYKIPMFLLFTSGGLGYAGWEWYREEKKILKDTDPEQYNTILDLEEEINNNKFNPKNYSRFRKILEIMTSDITEDPEKREEFESFEENIEEYEEN